MTKPSSEPLLRRQYPRRRIKKEMTYLFSGHYIYATGADIGEGGMSFLTDQKLELGRHIVVNFKMPEGPFISVRAEIKNVREQGKGQTLYGVAFENLKFDWKREIRNFVTARQSADH